MISNNTLLGFQTGLATLGLTAALGACGSQPMNGDGGDVFQRDASVVDSAVTDASHADAGRCSMASLNPPASLRFRAYDVRYGGAGGVASATLPFGGVFVDSDLILPITDGTSTDAGITDASRDASLATGGTNSFLGLMRLGSIFELPSTDDRVRRRVNGDPLATLSRPGVSNWDDAFAGIQNIGLVYTVQGRFDPASCSLNLILRGAVNQAAGLSTNQPILALPVYGPRTDGRYDLAAADFSNEAMAVFNGGLTLNLNLRNIPVGDAMTDGAVYVVCDNNCPTIPGSSVRRLEVILTTRPARPSAPDAGTDASTDASVDASIDAALFDARPESGVDAAADAGTDATADAARLDAATDARDAGDAG